VAFLGTSYFPADRSDSELVVPEDKKIVWYPLQRLPTITPTERIGTAPVPQAAEKRNQTFIHDDPEAKPGKQLLWRPDTQKKIEREIPAPNLVAVEAPREPAKPRNVFRLPERTPQTKQAPEIPTAPAIQLAGTPGAALKLPGVLAVTPKVTRPFVAPARQAVHRQATDYVIEPPTFQSGDLRAGAGNPTSGALDSVIGKALPPARRQFVPPSPTSSAGLPNGPVTAPELDGAPAAGVVDAAVLNAAPLDKLLTAIPDGSRSVRMSGAPTQGPTASGPVTGAAGLQIPGVAVLAGATPPGTPTGTAPNSPPRPERTYQTRNAVRRATLSAPLRPSSRIIPQFIESRFHDRVLYTMIIGKPQAPVYAQDWVLWFAEKQPKAGDAPQMRAPQPVLKVDKAAEQPESIPTGRVQFAATILKNGRVDSIAVLSGAVTAPSQAAAIKDLQSWQFAPALRDGEAVDVDVVLEIPFQTAVSTLSTGASRR
jgi:hypothetical protein